MSSATHTASHLGSLHCSTHSPMGRAREQGKWVQRETWVFSLHRETRKEYVLTNQRTSAHTYHSMGDYGGMNCPNDSAI